MTVNMVSSMARGCWLQQKIGMVVSVGCCKSNSVNFWYKIIKNKRPKNNFHFYLLYELQP